jgi:chromosome transmission fidelity protein 1
MSDYTSHLFPYLPSTRITTLSCGHVIPKNNLIAWNLSKGPSGAEFEFTYTKRSDGSMIDELGRALLNICTVVPDGVVVFFPSYSYLSSILTRWSLPPSKPGDKNLLERLSAKKAVFQESKEMGIDTILHNYATAIDSGKGGLLLSVVGGKMSEGINFSDRLGRCVVIVGLPFPNAASAEWKAKMEYLETSTISRLEAQNLSLTNISSSSTIPASEKPTSNEPLISKLSQQEILSQAKNTSRAFYENACMRAVNQSIGRAIRHQNDYAAIVMIDKRFSGERIKGKLPGWIRMGLVESAGEKNFGALMGGLSAFFRGKKGV